MLKKFLSLFKKIFGQFQEFKQRIWIISIKKAGSSSETYLNETFVVSEDSFTSSLQWMVAKHYSSAALTQVENMKLSQIISLEVGEDTHSIMRVK